MTDRERTGERDTLARSVGRIAETLKLSVIDCVRVSTSRTGNATRFHAWYRGGYYEHTITDESVLCVGDLSLLWLPMIQEVNRGR